MDDFLFPIVVLGGIIAIALFGGAKNANIFGLQNFALLAPPQSTVATTTNTPPPASSYTNTTYFSWGSFSNNPNQEYVEVINNGQNPIDITGWKIHNNDTHQDVTITHSTNLYSAQFTNDQDDVLLYPGEQAYIITGRSPIGYGIRANICSGYLSQTNTFTPGLYTQCPTPQQESVGITKSPINNNCLDLIDQTAACSIHSQALDNTYTSQCQQFFSTTLTYQGCVDLHKKDSDFYSPKKWYVYLNRDSTLWNVERESVTLIDNTGKSVQTIAR